MSISYSANILRDLFNKCLEVGKFPDLFKIATITPILKKGPNNDIKNYRPVAVLPNISKNF